MPSPVARPERFAAEACPFTRRISIARSTSPPASASAGLLLRPDEQDGAALAGDLRSEAPRLGEQALGLEQIDDVDSVALAPDVALHPRVPAAGLVAKVEPRLQELPDSRLCHRNSLLPWRFRLACRRDPGAARAGPAQRGGGSINYWARNLVSPRASTGRALSGTPPGANVLALVVTRARALSRAPARGRAGAAR